MTLVGEEGEKTEMTLLLPCPVDFVASVVGHQCYVNSSKSKHWPNILSLSNGMRGTRLSCQSSGREEGIGEPELPPESGLPFDL